MRGECPAGRFMCTGQRYDTVLFLRSIYNQLHPVTNRIGLIIFSLLSFPFLSLDVIYELSNI